MISVATCWSLRIERRSWSSTLVCFPQKKGSASNETLPKKGAFMCQSCIDIDKRIEKQRESLRSVTDPAEIVRINRLIAQLYADRVRLHKSPEK